MGRPKRQARDEILRAARERFVSKGIRSVTMGELARELGTSKATIYREFPSKEVMVGEVMTQLNREIDARLRTIVHSRESFPTKLRRVTDFTAALVSGTDERFLRDLAVETPEIWKEYQRRRRERVEVLYGALFEQGRSLRYIRRDIPLGVLVEVYFNLTRLTVDSMALKEAKTTSREMYLAVGELFLHGVQGARRWAPGRGDTGETSRPAPARTSRLRSRQ